MIKLIKSTFYQEEKTKKSLCEFILKSSQLSFGEECKKFEKNFAKYQGRKDCIFVNSGSSANLALIQALLNLNRLKQGDTVGFSSLTWSTNTMPLLQLGLKAIPIDVELETLNVSSKKLLKVLDKYNLKALFITNLLGFCDDLDKIKEICQGRNIILLEDNCESLGTIYKETKLGNFGHASTFSFYVGHHMSTIEGGAICTDDDELSTMLRLVRAHGWDRNLNFARRKELQKKFKINSTFYSRYTFYDLGFNLRPTEINGFIGNLQLKYIDEVLNKRKENFVKIADAIYKNKNYYPIKFDHIDFISNFAIPVVCKSEKVRDELVNKCKNLIEIRPIVGGDITQQPFFQRHMGDLKVSETNAKLVHKQGLYFGNNPELTQDEIKTILEVFA